MTAPATQYAVLTPFTAAWLLRQLRDRGVDSHRVRGVVIARRQAGDGARATELAEGWQQLLQAEEWMSGQVRSASPLGSTETPSPAPRALSPADAITTEDAARRLGVTPRRVRQLIDSGVLSASKTAGAWLIDPDTLDAVHDTRRHHP